MAGYFGTIELPAVETWDPRTGGGYTRRFKGPEVLLRSLAMTHKSAGARIEFTPPEEGGISELRATYGASDTQSPTEPLADVWSIVGNDLEKDLWTHPKMVSECAKATDDVGGDSAATKLSIVRGEIEALVKGEREVTHDDGNTYALTAEHILLLHVANLGAGVNLTTWQDFIKTLAAGETSFVKTQTVLQHSLVIAANSSIRPALTNVDCVYTTAQLRIAENIPDTIRFDLPDGEWLKKAAKVEQESADKWRIVQEWWWAETWNSWVYARAS